ncbi:MAG: DUF2158 domain-containing protein [Bryobacterales bacterium]|nr:DUF2158 domain-containing protein [Bryobacterales bacterium]
MEFKKGDIVKLKSGGPDMTINVITDRESAECWWFVDGDTKWQTFGLHALDKVDLQARAIGNLR